MAFTRTLSKKFNSFEDEEHWLNELAQSGWRLVDYSKGGLAENHYHFHVDLDAKNMHYKIDYRTIKNREEFDDYKELFHETGWELIAKNHSYLKYIFISAEGQEIFSDHSSVIDRDRRRRNVVLIFIIGFGIAALSSLAAKLYADYDWLNVLIIMYTALVVWYSYTFYKYHRKIRQLKQLR